MSKYMIFMFGMVLTLIPALAAAASSPAANVNPLADNAAWNGEVQAGGVTAALNATGSHDGGRILLVDRDDHRGRGEHQRRYGDDDRDWDHHRGRYRGYNPNWGRYHWNHRYWSHGRYGRGPWWYWGNSRCFWLLDPYGNQVRYFCE